MTPERPKLYIYNSYRSKEAGRPSWSEVENSIYSTSKSRIGIRYLDIMVSRMYNKYVLKYGCDLGGACHSYINCAYDYGFNCFDGGKNDVFTEQEIEELNSLHSTHAKLIRSKRCGLPLRLLPNTCRHRLLPNAGYLLPKPIPIYLDVSLVYVDELEYGDLFFNVNYDHFKQTDYQIPFLLDHVNVKLQDIQHYTLKCHRVNNLIVSDTYLSEIKKEFGINLGLWFNILPKWYGDLQFKIKSKHSDGL